MLQIDVIIDKLPFILGGVWVTIQLTVVALISGLPLGVALGLMQTSNYRTLKYLSSAYVSIFRGTPILVQLMVIFNAL
ncbi:MAG: ABC transporter permease subunit, partial [Alphaproteobacteria bacterium]|nr:ABC transporter permease subunit [Alphaproteobacteria bacterium]